jgi:hypothetical protein
MWVHCADGHNGTSDCEGFVANWPDTAGPNNFRGHIAVPCGPATFVCGLTAIAAVWQPMDSLIDGHGHD